MLGIEKWNNAIKNISGGNDLISKRPERYAPDIWATYYQSCTGVLVTDLDFIGEDEMYGCKNWKEAVARYKGLYNTAMGKDIITKFG